jgi:F-type H+-transporting ATPase subunit delta
MAIASHKELLRMPNQTHPSPVAVSYARALLELANESNATDATAQELADLQTLVDTVPGFAEYLADPSIGTTERNSIIDKVFKGNVSDLTARFLGVLVEHGKGGLLPHITTAFTALLQAQRNIIEVDVHVAQRLDQDQLDQVRQRVGAALNKEAVIHQYVDESLIGGLVLRVGDQLIDGSVKAQLTQIRQQMLTAKPG